MTTVNKNETEIEAMLDDPDAWEAATPSPAPKKKSEQRKRGAMVSVRLTPEELSAVQQAAERDGLTVSKFMRARALAEAGGRRPMFGQTPRNTTFSEADTIWRGDFHVNVGPYWRESVNH